MKTIFEPSIRGELINRINALNENSVGQWGKMNVTQMTKHCILWNGWVLGTNGLVFKQAFLGKIFGKMALKSSIKDEKPFGKNLPAGAAFTIRDKEGDLPNQLAAWKSLINDYEHFSNHNFIHDFFGKMTKEEIGIFSYKHNDHHLRQFGV